jgi:hypothetical protein
MRERPNRHAWKACVGQLTVGSNPTPSASVLVLTTSYLVRRRFACPIGRPIAPNHRRGARVDRWDGRTSASSGRRARRCAVASAVHRHHATCHVRVAQQLSRERRSLAVRFADPHPGVEMVRVALRVGNVVLVGEQNVRDAAARFGRVDDVRPSGGRRSATRPRDAERTRSAQRKTGDRCGHTRGRRESRPREDAGRFGPRVQGADRPRRTRERGAPRQMLFLGRCRLTDHHRLAIRERPDQSGRWSRATSQSMQRVSTYHGPATFSGWRSSRRAITAHFSGGSCTHSRVDSCRQREQLAQDAFVS